MRLFYRSVPGRSIRVRDQRRYRASAREAVRKLRIYVCVNDQFL